MILSSNEKQRIFEAIYQAESPAQFLFMAQDITGIPCKLYNNTRLFGQSSAGQQGLRHILSTEAPQIIKEKNKTGRYTAEDTQGGQWLCQDMYHQNGLFCCTIAIQPDKSESEQAYEAILDDMGIAFQKSICLCENNTDTHPDAFLLTTDVRGAGSDYSRCSNQPNAIYYLYCPISMMERSGGQLCAACVNAVQALHVYVEEAGFGIAFACQQDKWNALQQPLFAILRQAGQSAGIAGPFYKPSRAQGSLEKARNAARYANAQQSNGQTVYEYSAVRWDILRLEARSALQEQGFRESDFLYQKVLALMQYDACNGTQYYESLLQYLTYGKNMKLAAHAMQIHRNTLDYRIKKIAEQFSIDFQDKKSCFEMLFTCRIMEGAGERGRG